MKKTEYHPHPNAGTGPSRDDLLPEVIEFLHTHWEGLLNTWFTRIENTALLQVREDISPNVSGEILQEFFALVCKQVACPGDYAPLRDYIQSGAITAFTPDAACRLQFAFKYTLLEGLREACADRPDRCLALCRYTETTMDELLLRIAEFYHEMRYKEIQKQEDERNRALKHTQERLQTLLETMNEGFTAVDTTETILLFNHRMEQITGYSRDEVIGKHVSTIYTPESQERLQAQLARRRRGESSSYELKVAHKDGRRIPVRISGAPLRDDRGHHIGSFAVVTDISDQVQAEDNLRKSNRQIARLLDAERKRAAHFATVNQVAHMALSTLDPDEIFRRVVRAVQERFDYYHAALFLTEGESNQVVLRARARAGAYEPYLPQGYHQEIGVGIVGTVVASGESLLANDVLDEPRRIIAFPEEENTRAELCVPIKLGERVIGALDVQSQETDVFDENDLTSLQVLADQIAWVTHNAQLFQEILHLNEFNEQVLQNIPLPVLLLDPDLIVVFANPSYREHHNLKPEELVNRSLEEAVPSSLLVQPEGRKALGEVFRTGSTLHLERQKVQIGAYQNRVVDILMSRVEVAEGTPLALVVIEDITESLEKAYQSSLLRQIGQTMQGILDLDRLLYTILTCVTAGTALGFNRAILLLVDQDQDTLEGRMGVGPSTQEEATRIWSELARRNPTVDDILADYDRLEDPAEAPLSRAARQVRIPLDDPDDVLARAVREHRTFTVTDGEVLAISPALWSALGTHQFVAVPLVVKDRALGVIVADNLYSGTTITDDNVDLLTAFAGHAALALDNAELYRQLEEKVLEVERAYTKLERTQQELVLSERLAVIGEMSARMAHEIRNPMATIGGFARSILKKPDPRRVKTAGSVILEETERLEKLLEDTLNFTRPSKPQLVPTDLNRLFQEVHTLIDGELQDKQVAYTEYLNPDLPTLNLDAAQIKQVLINLLHNALQAMPSRGNLTVTARCCQPPPQAQTGEARSEWVEIEIRDTGEGIPAEHLEQIFSPFFTTKTYGTGLGLAICKKIVEDHAGALTLESQPDQGTTVRVQLPSQIPQPEV